MENSKVESDITVEALRSMKFKFVAGKSPGANAYALVLPGGNITIEFMDSEPGYVGDLFRVTAAAYQHGAGAELPRLFLLSQLTQLVYWMGGLDYRGAFHE